MDYRKPVTEVFTDVARYMIRRDRTLNMLCLPAMYGGEIHGRPLPSWVPNLHTFGDRQRLLKSRARGRSARYEHGNARMSERMTERLIDEDCRPGVLRIIGVEIGCISTSQWSGGRFFDAHTAFSYLEYVQRHVDHPTSRAELNARRMRCTEDVLLPLCTGDTVVCAHGCGAWLVVLRKQALSASVSTTTFSFVGVMWGVRLFNGWDHMQHVMAFLDESTETDTLQTFTVS